jgi:midasin
MSINPGTDTMDILGSFEQIDNRRTLSNILDEVIAILEAEVCISPSIPLCIDQHIAYSLRRDCDNASPSELPSMIQNVFNITSRLFALDSSFKDRYGAIQDTIRRLMEAPFEAGRFEWVDGPLIHAMKYGQWILLEGANLCNPSVLDRLNSLCEHGGCLTLSERGFVGGAIQVIKPHPNFRLFMAVDPQHGELSRAMRNRGVEIFLEIGYTGNDIITLQDFKRLPLRLPPHLHWGQEAAFEAIRRGMLFQKALDAPATSTGRSLDQDSALAYLVDATPILLSTRQQSDNPNPWIFFLNRSLVPAYMPSLLRYLKTLRMETLSNPVISKFLQNFPDESLSEALVIYRQSYSLQNKISFNTILAQVSYFLQCVKCLTNPHPSQ